MVALISVPYILVLWMMGKQVQQQEYSNRAACENARAVVLAAALDKQGQPRRDINAVCVTKFDVD